LKYFINNLKYGSKLTQDLNQRSSHERNLLESVGGGELAVLHVGQVHLVQT